jgi:hypothetical protein
VCPGDCTNWSTVTANLRQRGAGVDLVPRYTSQERLDRIQLVQHAGNFVGMLSNDMDFGKQVGVNIS